MVEFTEQEKLEKAISIISSLSEGIDFYTGRALEEDNILNNPKYIRLFKYVEELLKYKVKLNGNIKKTKFTITKEQIEKIEIPDTALSATRICEYLNKYVDLNLMKKLSGQDLNLALMKYGVIENKVINNKKHWFVTDKYIDGYGIIPRTYANESGMEYTTLNYEPKGQKFIIDNLIEILEMLD